VIYLDAAREVILLAVLVIAAFTDLAYGKVYNWTTVPAMLAGVMLAIALGGVGTFGQTLPSGAGGAFGGAKQSFCLIDSALGLVMAGGIFGAFFLMGAFGAADVKLAVAIGALKGWYFTLLALGASALMGGVLALAVLVWKGKLRRGLRDSLAAVLHPGKVARQAAESPARLTVPYCFAISVGTLWVWLARAGVW